MAEVRGQSLLMALVHAQAEVEVVMELIGEEVAVQRELARVVVVCRSPLDYCQAKSGLIQLPLGTVGANALGCVTKYYLLPLRSRVRMAAFLKASLSMLHWCSDRYFDHSLHWKSP